nr:G-type lectin S-receptor-like serine/threonine-protein kinase At1g61550 isoform X1 [Ipomoea batatas]
MPDFGGGYGAGFGGPNGGGFGGPNGGGYAKGGTVRPTVVCKEKGPCYGKTLSFATASEIHVDLLQNDRALDKNNLDSGDSRSETIVVDQFTTFKRGFLWLRRNLILRVSLYGSTQFLSSSTARSHRSLNVCSSKEKNETFDSKALIVQRGFSSRSDLGSLIPRGKPFNLLLAIPERCIKAIKASHKVIGNEESLELLGDSLELPIIGFDELVAATNNFSDDNKLGAGGFGPVYKGILTDGQEIAVKRLYSFSGQGIEEFKNEILLISKLQHRNLVRLLGCSIHGEEKLLVYEHMKNKSLDIILFGPNPPAPSLLSSLKLLVAATSSSKAIIGSSDESLSSTQSSSLEAVYRLDNQSFATQSRYPQSHSSPPGYRCPGAAGQDYS